VADHDDDYKVGPGKPPKHTRFKKGESGNKKGRRKGSKTIKSIIEKVLLGDRPITVNGHQVKATHIEAALLSILTRNIKGEKNAETIVAGWIQPHLPVPASAVKYSAPDMGAVSDEASEDKDILDALERDLRQRIIRTDGGGGG
jgi:hypothetical protein